MKWTEMEIENHIKKLMAKLNIDRMPTNTEMRENGFSGLSRAITINGGFHYWMNKMKLDRKEKHHLWDDDRIKEHIIESLKILHINRMPSASELTSINRNDLHNAISKSTLKYSGWAKKLGLEMKHSETKKGNDYEFHVANILKGTGNDVKKMTTKHPYDLLVNDCVKIDVKVSGPHHHFGPRAHTFALNKKYATCDIYVCVALDENGKVEKYFIIPSKDVQLVTLNICGDSKYNKYIHKWGLIQRLSDAYKNALVVNL